MQIKASVRCIYHDITNLENPGSQRNLTKMTTKGARDIEYKVQSLKTRISCCVTAESGRPHSIITSSCVLKHKCCLWFSRTPRSAPLFTMQPRVQPSTERMQRGRRGDQATENARHMTPRHGWKNALDCQRD